MSISKKFTSVSCNSLGAGSESAHLFFAVLKRYLVEFFRRLNVTRLTDIIKLRNFMVFALTISCAFFVVGCKEAVLSSPEQVEAFKNAGPIMPEVDVDRLLGARNASGIYEVSTGDVLEFQMPTVLTAVSPDSYKNKLTKVEPHLSRISDSGFITLPIIGQIDVDGRTLASIEDEVVGLYYPKYLVVRPSVVCTVKEYRMENVTVVGAVAAPGVYQMKNNEMSLVNLIMKAGGIVEDGASLITIKNPKRNYHSYVKSPESVEVTESVFEPEIYSGMTPGSVEIIESVPEVSMNNNYIEYDSGVVPIVEADEVVNLEELEFDLVFRPGNSTPSAGVVVIERDGRELYSSYLDITNRGQRIEYIRGLEAVAGHSQANIVSQALEQLASQLAPAVVSGNVTTFSIEDDELYSAADEYHSSDSSHSGCATCDDNYIEYPAAEKQVSSYNYDEPVVSYVEPVAVAGSGSATVAMASAGSVDAMQPIVLPVKGLNIPFADVDLVEGDVVEVKRLNGEVFTVIGLAKEPGAFPYPPDVHYNLMQAIGFAGGVDMIADPRFVSIYRQGRNGSVVSATFRIDDKFRTSSYNVMIKSGDVISVENTARTKMNALVHQVLRINVGLYAKPGF